MSDGKSPGAASAFRVPLLLLLLAAGPSAGLAQSNPPPGLPPGLRVRLASDTGDIDPQRTRYRPDERRAGRDSAGLHLRQQDTHIDGLRNVLVSALLVTGEDVRGLV